MAAWWKQSDAYEAIERRGAVVDIGQVGPAAKRALNNLAAQGVVTKYRGHWDTKHAAFGMGPLKTIWAVPRFAKEATELTVALSAEQVPA